MISRLSQLSGRCVGRGKASFDELRNYLSPKLHSAPEMLVSKNWQKKEINVKVKDESDFNLKTLFFCIHTTIISLWQGLLNVNKMNLLLSLKVSLIIQSQTQRQSVCLVSYLSLLIAFPSQKTTQCTFTDDESRGGGLMTSLFLKCWPDMALVFSRVAPHRQGQNALNSPGSATLPSWLGSCWLNESPSVRQPLNAAGVLPVRSG